MSTRSSRLTLLVCELTFAGLALYATFGAGGWSRLAAVGMLAAVVALRAALALLVLAHASLCDRRMAALARSSLEARDEIVQTYCDRQRELHTVRNEMAHALKNPLASIKGLVGLMALEPERSPERLSVLRGEVCRMQSIVEEYLSFARPLTPLETESVDVKAALTEVAALHEGIAGAKGVSLDLSQVDAVRILGDRQKLKQMLVSLMLNAIEASAWGAPIELLCKRRGDRVVVGVLDRGPGVPVDLLPRLTVAGTTTKESGTGLGLTIVRSLAEQHGGSLHLRNREGGGFAAELQLPLRCCAGKVVQRLA